MTILLAIETLASQDAKTLKGVLTTMKQEIKVVAIMLAMTLVLLCGVAVGTVNGGINITVNGGTGSVATGNAGSAGSTGATSTPPQQSMENAEEKEQVQSSSGLEMPQDGDAVNITKAYNKAINDVRAYTGTVTLKKTETVDIKAKDIPKAIEGVVNGVVSGFLGTTENTYTYNNGVDEGGGPLGERIIPWGRDATVTPADIASCSIKENSDGGYTITMTFLAESVTFDGTTGTEPVHHKTAMDPLNLATLSIDPIKISSAEMNYPGATVELTVDSQGRIVNLHNFLPLNGVGKGGVGPIKASLGLEGSMDATYVFTY